MKNIYFVFLKKTTATIILLIMLASTIGFYMQLSTKNELLTSSTVIMKTREELLEDFSLFLLYPYIQDALVDYYGRPKQFWQDKVIDIRKVDIDYRYFLEITVEVETYEGAHNPPRGRDILTFRTKEYSSSLKLINYKHQDI